MLGNPHQQAPKEGEGPQGIHKPMYYWGLVDKKALADLGTSINLMSYKIFQKLGLGEHKPTQMALQLAHRSTRHPRGRIEDVLVKVDIFIFPVDFVTLDLEVKLEVPLILR